MHRGECRAEVSAGGRAAAPRLAMTLFKICLLTRIRAAILRVQWLSNGFNSSTTTYLGETEKLQGMRSAGTVWLGFGLVVCGLLGLLGLRLCDLRVFRVAGSVSAWSEVLSLR